MGQCRNVTFSHALFPGSSYTGVAAAFMKTHTMILLIVNAIYLAYRVGLHFASFSGWHWVGLGFTSFVYLLTYYLLRESAKPRYAPLNDGGALLSGGEDMDAQGGVIEYTRDMLYVTAFIQLATGFVSDWFWLLHLVPPSEELARLLLCMLILCAVYTPIILLAYAAGQRLIEREMARYYDLC